MSGTVSRRRQMLNAFGIDDTPTNRVAVYINGQQEWVAPPQPNVQAHQLSATVNVYDGQTLVLGGLVSHSESKNTRNRLLLIFATPTIVDPAGNRIHPAEGKPSAPDRIPLQPTR